jgi:large subunit ribosomal protein L14
MVQLGSYLKVVDNSGVRFAYCIRVPGGYKRRYARLGDTLTVVVNRLRKRRRQYSKLKQGQIVTGLIVRTKINKTYFFNDKISFLENSIILISKKNQLFGTRIFGMLPKNLRYSRYMKLIILAKGLKS